MSAATTAEIASWMMAEFQKKKILYQDDAAEQIQKRFGKGFIYDNENGNPAIDKKVLAAFNKVSGKDVVWSRSGRYWRPRSKGDEPGRMQSD